MIGMATRRRSRITAVACCDNFAVPHTQEEHAIRKKKVLLLMAVVVALLLLLLLEKKDDEKDQPCVIRSRQA